MIFYEDENITLFNADVIEGLRQIESESIQCCVTSPPYWGLRDYGVEGQLGLEKTPEEYIEKMVLVFREVHRVLKKDGTIWINIGDSYVGGGRGGGQGDKSSKQNTNKGAFFLKPSPIPERCKPKDLVGIPWMLAFALRSDGWYLRQDIIWSKPNPMPESVTDRCTKAHEYVFLLSKSKKYYYDADTIREPLNKSSIERLSQNIKAQIGSARVPGKTNGNMKAVGKTWEQRKSDGEVMRHGLAGAAACGAGNFASKEGANKRSVWNIPTQSYSEAHFATFPPKLIEPCILAGSRANDIVLDPFWGSGTTGEVARNHQRKAVGIELNPEYCELSLKRFKQAVLF